MHQAPGLDPAQLPRRRATRGLERVVFVDFEDTVSWGQVIATMDSVRSLAADVNHDEVKVALKVKEEAKPAQ